MVSFVSKGRDFLQIQSPKGNGSHPIWAKLCLTVTLFAAMTAQLRMRIDMPKTALLLTVATLSLCACSPAPQPEIDQDAALKQSKVIMDAYDAQYNAILEEAFSSHDPEEAVRVYHAKVPLLAKSLSKFSGAEVGRAGLKPVNMNAIATPPEAAQLAKLKDAPLNADGTPKEVVFVTGRGADAHVHYMRAAVIGEKCVACHGVDVNGDVQAVEGFYYPSAKGIGFKEGALYGAYTVVWPASKFVKP